MSDQGRAPAPGGTPPTDDRGQGIGRQILEFVITLAAALVLALALRTWVIEPFVVPTGSMLPTIQLSDQVLANKFIYRFEDPKPGDIVVFDDPMGEVPTLIKRVIAVGGQTVDLRDGKVVVDGKALDEPYTHGQPSDPLKGSDVTFPLTVPKGYIWVMGDNRTKSKDSRWFGPIPLKMVRGKAFFTYLPLDRIGPLN